MARPSGEMALPPRKPGRSSTAAGGVIVSLSVGGGGEPDERDTAKPTASPAKAEAAQIQIHGTRRGGAVGAGVGADAGWRVHDGVRLSIDLDRSDETVSAARNSLHKTRIASFVADHLADLLDRGVQSVVEFYERLGRPQLFAQLVAGDQFTMALQKSLQEPARLLLNADFTAAPEKLARSCVQFENTEAIDPGS